MKRKWIYFLLIGIICFEFVLFLAFKDAKFSHWILYISPFVRMFDYILGGGIWKLVQYKKQFISGNILSIIAMIVLAGLMMLSVTQSSEAFSVFVWVLPVAILVFSIGINPNSRVIKFVFCNDFIVYIGEISFEIFLIHQIVMRYVAKLFDLEIIIGLIVDVALTLLCVNMWRILVNIKIKEK